MISRYGRDLVLCGTPLRVLLDCTDVMLMVAACLGVPRDGYVVQSVVQRVEGAKRTANACLCLAAYGGHRAMVEVMSSALCGVEGVAQWRLNVQDGCCGRTLAWWAGAGGRVALFRELVWGASASGDGDAAWAGPETSLTGTGTRVVARRDLPSDVVLSAVGGAAFGGLLNECRRGLELLRGMDGSGDSEWGRKGVAEALLFGSEGGRVDVVDWAAGLVLEEGLDVNGAVDECRRTALHMAAERGHVSVLERLVCAFGDRLDVNAKDHWGTTALHWAAHRGDASVVERLVCAFGDRLDMNATDKWGTTALDLANARMHTSVARLLAPRPPPTPSASASSTGWSATAPSLPNSGPPHFAFRSKSSSRGPPSPAAGSQPLLRRSSRLASRKTK
jgi:Ankyrin repeats (many copies)